MEKLSSIIVLLLPLIITIATIWGLSRLIKNLARKYPPVAPGQSNSSGVGGWLLLLVLGLTILGPFTGIGRIILGIKSIENTYPAIITTANWGIYKTAIVCAFVLFSCLSIYAGSGLITRRDYLIVTRTKIILWVIGPIATMVLGLIVPLLTFGNAVHIVGPKFIGNMIASCGAAAIWTFYLSKSKRVEATYGNNRQSNGLSTPKDGRSYLNLIRDKFAASDAAAISASYLYKSKKTKATDDSEQSSTNLISNDAISTIKIKNYDVFIARIFQAALSIAAGYLLFDMIVAISGGPFFSFNDFYEHILLFDAKPIAISVGWGIIAVIYGTLFARSYGQKIKRAVTLRAWLRLKNWFRSLPNDFR